VKEEGATILMAAHDPRVDEYVDDVLQLSDGQILETENQPG
jgi:ABC-type lipoprotein export system ATPase subunit